jgi:predicted N-acetyltransferase YhbS
MKGRSVPDMLVRLYALPDLQPALRSMAQQGIVIRRPEPATRTRVEAWVGQHFTEGWRAECATAFTQAPPACFVAYAGPGIVGFACHDCTRKNFFGPTGVAVEARGTGIGRALLLVSLYTMRDSGYAYAIIGGVGPAAFYTRTVGATPIEGSTPGIYAPPGVMAR